MLEIGTQVEDFEVKDQNEQSFKLSAFRGKKVLLSFHPLAWTSICEKQMKSLEANQDTFESLNTVAVGVSVDSVPCKKAWAEHIDVKRTRLLCDFWPHGHVAELLKVFRHFNGFSERANVIVDEEGKVIFSKVYPMSEVPDINEIIDFLKGK
ncbi:MAG: redoxin domain-containing protein [Candidatus Atribacteria bacterium]|nr:redoxin domain-containing protein [Candidatus Atribacteria bacterium]